MGRTTINIDDDVLVAAKQRAAAEGRSLGDVVSEALRERLARRPARGKARYRAVVAGKGGPLPGVDVTNNSALRDVMDGE